MEKIRKRFGPGLFYPQVKKFVRLMKLTALLVIFAFTQAFAIQSYSQTTRLSLNMNNSSVKDVLMEIEKSSDYFFLYSNKLIDVDRKVNIKLTDKKISEILDEVFQGTDVKYDIKDRQIILRPKSSEYSIADFILQRPIPVTGTVMDESGNSIPGATVILKGTTQGTITDGDGNFSIEISGNNPVLIFSFVGMKTEEVPYTGQPQIKVTLKSDVIGLDEVVAVGYGTMKKSDLTGSVASVDAGTIVGSRSTTSVSAIQGKVAGVDIVRSSNKPGGGFDVKVRGVSTFGSNTSPLYVVDGIVVDNINDINPEDIKKIDILKDASSSAIYGSRGANGVVIVTTNGGTEGKTVVDYNGYVGVKQAYNLPDIMNTDEFVQFAMDAQVGKGDTDPQLSDQFGADEIANINNGVSTNWPELITKTGTVTNHSVNVSGGSNGTIFNYGVSVLSEDGVVGEEQYDRYTIKSSNEKKFNNVLTFGVKNNMSYSIRNEDSNEAFRSAYRLRPTGSPYDADGNLQLLASTKELQITNPILDLQYQDAETKAIHYFGNVYLKLEPTNDLTFTTTLSPDLYFERYGEYRGLYTKNSRGEQARTRAYYNTNNYMKYTWDNILNYKKDINEHHFAGTFVTSVYKKKYDASVIQRRNFSTDAYSFYNIEAGSDIAEASSQYLQETLASFLGRITYDYKNKYYLTVNGRYDGSSRLAQGNKWAFFPSAALAWRITEEDFMKSSSTFNNLKLRLSYGKTGNASVDPYQSQVNMALSYYDWGGTGASGMSIDGIANYALTWEKTSEFNMGIDYALLDSRISGSIELYSRLSQDILYQRNIPALTGYNTVWDNVGSLSNQGIEVALNTVNVNGPDFRWTTSIMFSSNKNKIKDINGSKEDDPGNGWFIGEDITSLWDYQWDGIWQLDEADQAAVYSQDPGEVKVVDQNSDNKIDDKDKVIIGKETPDWYGSITNSFQYKNFDLNIFIYTRQGSMVYSKFHEKFAWDQDGRFNGLKKNYWTPDNPSNDWHEPQNAGSYRNIENYQDMSFVKVGYINFGYSFNSPLLSRIHAKKLRLYVSAQNPFVFTKYEGFDPEYSNDTYNDTFMSRSFLFGVNVQF